MIISILGLWQFVQSERFAKFLSIRLQKTVFKHIAGKLEFGELNIGFFPPSTVIKNFNLVHYTKNNETIIFRFNSVGIHFSALDVFSNRISVDKLMLENGFIEFSEDINFQSNTKDNLPIKEMFLLFKRDVLGFSPVKIKSMYVKDVMILNKKNRVDISDIDLKIYNNYFVLKGMFDQIHINKANQSSFYDHDSIYVDIELSKEQMNIKEIKITDRLNLVTAEGKIKDGQTGYNWKGKVKYRGGINKIESFSAVLAALKFKKVDLGNHINRSMIKKIGYFDIEAETYKDKKDFNLSASIQGYNIETPWFLVDHAEMNIKMDPQKVIVSSLKIKKDGGMVKTIKPVKIFNMKKKKIIPIKTKLTVHNLFTNDFLYFLKPLNILKGRCQGNVNMTWENQMLSFDFDQGFILSQFKLKKRNSNINILQNDKIIFNSGSIKILSQEKVLLSADLKILETKLKGNGVINLKKRNVDIEIKSSIIDLFSFGPVAGLPLHGKGPLEMHIVGPFEDTQFKMDVNLDDFKVKGFELGNLSGKAVFFLKDRLLALKNIKSERAFSLLKGDGFFEFKKIPKWRLNIDIKKSDFKGPFFLAKPILKSFEDKLKSVSCRIKGNIHIEGVLRKDQFLVSGNIYAQNIYIHKKEEISTLKASYRYRNGILKIINVSAKKATGYLNGKAKINIKKKIFEYNAQVSNISLKDIYFYRLLGLKYHGMVYGESKGSGSINNYVTKTSLKIKEGTVGSKNVGDSVLDISSGQKRITFSGKLFENIGKLNGRISLEGKKELSYFKWDVNVPDAYLLAGLFSEKNILDTTMEGNLYVSMDAKFSLSPFNIAYAKLDIKKFSFKKENIRLDIIPGKNYVMINNNKISRWNIDIRGPHNFVKSYGKGNISKNFKIKQAFKLDTSLAAVVLPKIQNMYGYLMGKHTVVGKNGSIFNTLKMKSEDIFLKIRGLPDAFSNLAIDVVMSGKTVILNKLNAVFGDGSINSKGKIILNFPLPKVDISLNVNSSKISFFKKSNVVASAKMNLFGDQLPYRLKGDISILHGSIQDEVKDIVGNTPAFKSYSKYIPKGRESKTWGYLAYNLNTNIFNPIVFSNSFANMKIIGACKVKGDTKNPLFDGELSIIKRVSKVMFKGNDFILTEGLLSVNDTKEKRPPRIKLVGISDINDYSVKLDVSGDLKSTKIELSSIPSLSREDILSLLTFGITSSTSKNLDEKDRRSVTTLGFGSLLVDQLKLNEGLASSLGLRFSLLPELEDQELSPLSGRSAEETVLPKKVKTATKIQIQKKISEKVDLSLSSTLGEAEEQKQTMNIIYNVNENFSLEGVYEIKSSDTEEEVLPNSGGVDLKYRFSF